MGVLDNFHEPEAGICKHKSPRDATQGEWMPCWTQKNLWRSDSFTGALGPRWFEYKVPGLHASGSESIIPTSFCLSIKIIILGEQISKDVVHCRT